MFKKGIKSTLISLLILVLISCIAPTKTVNAAYKGLNLKASVNTSYHVELKWKKKSVSYYKIYRSAYSNELGSSGKYIKIATISGKRTSFTDKKIKKNKYYDYIIKGYKKGKVKYYDDTDSIRNGLPDVGFDDYFFAEGKVSPSSITIEGFRYSGMTPTGFVIYRKDAKAPNSAYKKIATCKSSNSFKHIDKTVKAGKDYTYRVRSYRVIKGKTVYGPSSEDCPKSAVNMFGRYDIEIITPKAEMVTKLQVKISPSRVAPYNGKLTMTKNDCAYVNTPTKEREKYDNFTYPSDDDIRLDVTKYSLDGMEWKEFPEVIEELDDNEIITFDGNQPFYLEFERNTYQDDTSAPPISPEFKYPEKNDGIVKIYGLYASELRYNGVPSFFTLDFNSGKGFTVEYGEAVH